MTDENDADVDRALAAFGGTTMKYLNFASPLLKRAARTPALTPASVVAKASYEPLFKRAAGVAPEIAPAPASPKCEPPASPQNEPPAATEAPAATTNEAAAFAPEPAVERGSPDAAATCDAIVSEPMAVQPIEPEPVTDEAAAQALQTPVAAASVQSEPPPLVAHVDEISGASALSKTAEPAPFTSLADHMLRVFGGNVESVPAREAVRPNPATDQAERSAPDRRTVAEMFRILAGSECLGRPVEVAEWRDTERSLFRRL